MRIPGRVTAGALLLALTVSSTTWASAPADGTFVAGKGCEAYVSKNKRTNPDGARLKVGTAYPVFEVNRPGDPDWYHVKVDSADPSARWVAGDCGTAKVNVAGGGGASRGGSSRPVACDVAGEADSYVFAVSWQAAFCKMMKQKGRMGGKPECKVTDPDAYQARNFTLHGLWPNKNACGTRYGWCGEQKQLSGNNFCDYPALEMMGWVRDELDRVMPSAKAGSCLQRHEWYKHGTCQMLRTDDGYFDLAATLVDQFNASGAARLMADNLGGEVKVTDFRAVVDRGLGEGASERMKLTCTGGNLVDVYINLPKRLAGASLGELIAEGKPSFSSNCGDSFRVVPLGDY